MKDERIDASFSRMSTAGCSYIYKKLEPGQNIKERVYMHLLMEITGQCTRRCRGITEDGIVEELEIMNI